MQEPVVAIRGQGERFVLAELWWAGADENADREVFVDHQHVADSDVVGGVVTGEDRVRGQVCVEGGLELVHQVPGRHPQQQLAAFGGDARVAGSLATAALFEEVLTDGAHRFHCAFCRGVRHAGSQ